MRERTQPHRSAARRARRFFRHQAQMDALRSQVLPSLSATRHGRCACGRPAAPAAKRRSRWPCLFDEGGARAASWEVIGSDLSANGDRDRQRTARWPLARASPRFPTPFGGYFECRRPVDGGAAEAARPRALRAAESARPPIAARAGSGALPQRAHLFRRRAPRRRHRPTFGVAAPRRMAVPGLLGEPARPGGGAAGAGARR